MLTNGRYVGIAATGATTGTTYQAVDAYGVASSVMQKNLSNNWLNGAMYDFSSVAIPVVPAGQTHQVVFPSYATTSGNVIANSLLEGPTSLADTTTVTGPTPYTLTVSLNKATPLSVHMQHIASNGVVADFDITAASNFSGNFNLSTNNGHVTLTGIASHQDNGSVSSTVVAFDFGVANTTAVESYIIIHTIEYASGKDYWRVNKAIQF